MVWKNKFNVTQSASGNSLEVRDKREFTGTWPTPIVRALASAEQIFTPPRNRFDLVDKFVENDPELAAGIDIKASMVRRSFRGMFLKVGESVSPEEEVLTEYLKTLADWLNFKRLFYITTKKLLRYGDWPMIKEVKGGLPRLTNMPIKYLSIVDNLRQLEDVDAQIFAGNYYILNEYREAKRKVFHKDRILHFSLEPEGTEIYDQYGRYTFNLYSVSPLLTLTQYILWKHNIIITDIMLRHKLLPREVHAVNTLGINPQTVGAAGDLLDTRIDKANAEIERVLGAYEQSIAYVGADRGYIVQAEGVDISILEPKGLNYHKPNEVIDQINAAYAKRLGVPVSELTSSTTESFATSVVKTSFATIRTVDVAECIADKLLTFVREHVITTYPKYASLVDRIYIDIDLVMDQEEERRFRIGAMMKQMGTFTDDEIRRVCGYENATEEQKKEIEEAIERMQKIVGKTPENVTAGSVRKRASDKSEFPDTPRQKEKEQVGM